MRAGRAVFAVVGLLFATPANAQSGDGALAPGLGLGGSIGLSGFGGRSNREISSGVGWEGHLSYMLPAGVYARGGVALGKHDLTADEAPWQFTAFFIEPRWIALRLSPRFAPFIAGRAARVSERVHGRSYKLRATGTAFGGGGGIALRLARQISIEAGVLFGRTRFDPYSFSGELAWRDCLDALGGGTPLPRSVVECSGSRTAGGSLIYCYPPYYTKRTSNCSPPEIPYPGTGRSGNWVRTWIGVDLALTGWY